MKPNYILVGAFVALACFFSSANAQVQINGIAYDTVTIKSVKVAQTVALPKVGDTDVRYSQASIVIPASVDLYGTSYPVKKIGNGSMRNNGNLISITLPQGLEIIGNSSFAQCSKLSALVLPSSVNSIEDWAFEKNTALASINFPSGITAINEHVFQECKALTSIVLPASVKSIKTCAFQDCDKLASINLEAITEIMDWSMSNTALTSLTVSNVVSIGDAAFSKMAALTSITLNNVGEISPWTFQNCKVLTSVTLSGTEMIQMGAFSGCTLLPSLKLPKSMAFIADWSLERSGIKKIYASWTAPLTDVIIEGNAFGSGDGKIDFKWYVPASVYDNWDDFFKSFLVELDLTSAIEDVNTQKTNVYYNAGSLSLTNLDGYQVSIFTVDGRFIQKLDVQGNEYQTTLKLNKGIYMINATKGSSRNVAKFMIK